jgi:hypothetical protein
MNFDGSFPSLLGGVSQQVPASRKDGQLSMQENMLSDIVSGLRRRPGVRALSVVSGFNPTATNVLSTYVEGIGGSYNVLINTTSGTMVVCALDGTVLSTAQHDYLKASGANALRETNVAGTSWLLNTEQVPVPGPIDTTKRNPVYDGWFYIRTGAFNKNYQVRIEWGATPFEVNYTTPAGTDASQVLAASPDGIATELARLINSGGAGGYMDAYRVGAYVFLTRKNKSAVDLTVTNTTTASGLSYMIASGSMTVNTTTDLPAKLPSEADGCVMAVGISDLARSYYRWVHNRSLWVETGHYAACATLINMPISYSINLSGTIVITTQGFAGRVAGDDKNNPYPAFLGKKVTGMASFQGRLVLLSGSTVNMSASTVSTNFMRSTTADLRDDDALETGSGSTAAASFDYAIQFNKDLVLIASTHQAIVPGGTVGITPKNALVSLIGRQTVDTNAAPVVVGRTLMYGIPTTASFFGVGELVPSAYSNSQYMPQGLTEHIPRYMPGRIRQICSSSTISTALFTSTTDYRGVLVHDYMWAGEERVHNAWHRWSFPADIASIHCARDQIMLTFCVGTALVICSMDVNSSRFITGGMTRPYMDLYGTVSVVDNKFTVPLHLRDPAKIPRLVLTQAMGPLAGEPVGIQHVDAATWTCYTVRSFPSGNLFVGWSYTSAFAPTPPVLKDKNENVINTSKVTLTRYLMNVQSSGEFDVHVSDQSNMGYGIVASAMHWSSRELGLNKPVVSGVGTVLIPCRSMAQTTSMVVSTVGVRELNVIDLEYTLRANMVRQRI